MHQLSVKHIAYYLPEQAVSNEDLTVENPSWDMTKAGVRIGVSNRYIAKADETAFDLSVKACERLFGESDKIQKAELDGLIFCTQSPDYLMPPNSCLLHEKLGLSDNVFAIDFNLACSGYVYGLGIAEGLLSARLANNILLVNADTYSKFINPKDRSTRALFGDGACVSWITRGAPGLHLLDITCATAGSGYDKFIIPAGGCRLPKSEDTKVPLTDENGNIRTAEDIFMDGMGMVSFVSTKVPPQILALLERNSMILDDIDLFVFHQASRLVLDSLARFLRIDADKCYQTLDRMGNTVSASIPIALRDAMDEGRISNGSTVLLSGFGVGLSWASAIVRVEA